MFGLGEIMPRQNGTKVEQTIQCINVINNLYKKSISPDDFQMKAQFTWYTEGDFINMHDDGPINTSSNRLCAVLIYLTPFELYNIGNV